LKQNLVSSLIVTDFWINFKINVYFQSTDTYTNFEQQQFLHKHYMCLHLISGSYCLKIHYI